MIPIDFDFKQPDYVGIWEWRMRTLMKIRETGTIDAFKAYYAFHPDEFISHWGSTYDPRNADIGLPTSIPFILFERQREWIDWTINKWHSRQPGLTEKSRDMGLSWLSTALGCTLCLHNDGIGIGFGSRKEEYVDKIGDPKSLFWKARFFMSKLPRDFRGGWDVKTHAPHMRILFPETGSNITGESGDGIGRGDRKSIYFVDEAAYIERPELIEASLSNTTNCRIDISSVHGMANPFAQKRFGGKIDVFTFHWRHDPRKADDLKIYEVDGQMVSWYDKMVNDIDPVTLAQEVDINYSASVEGVVIPAEWARAAIDAHLKLGIELTGSIDGALDVADQGIDLNAFAIKKGIGLTDLYEWSGKASDPFYTVEKAFNISDETDCASFLYDADGIGANVRGDSRVINDRRKGYSENQIQVNSFRGSAEVLQPEHEMVKGRKNKDFFMNFKAQSWWALRLRFRNTYRAVTENKEYDPDQLISISSKMKLLPKLMIELSQPTYVIQTSGKILIDKKPDGTKSPNLADSIMMLYSPRRVGLFS